MADNVTIIPDATPINFYLGNYAYTDIVSDMKILQYRLDTAGSERIFYRNAAGTLFKIMTDASDGTNAPEGSIFFADSIGACKSSTNLLFSNETIKLNNLTASRVVITNADKELISSDITVTELNALDNISSNIQEQINALGQISGTAGYLAKFDLNSLQDSILYEQDITHNIGIGTSDPQRPLHINNATPYIRLSDSDAASTTASTGWIEWYYQTTYMAKIGFSGTENMDFYIHNELDGDILFSTNSVERMRITNTGNIGIGINDPQQSLHINTDNPRIRLSDANAVSTSQATGGLEWYKQNTLLGSVYFNLNSLHIQNDIVSGDILFYTAEAGNSPTQKMKITSDGLINITTCYNAGTDTDKFLVLDSSGNIDYRTGTQILSDIGAATLSLTATYIPKATSSSTLGDSSICENGSTSFVGINTATPLARLDIAEAREMAEAITLCIGADLNNYTRTTNTRKISRFASVPYSLSEELTAILYTDNSSTYSHLKIGGGTVYMNAVTDIIFYTAEDITTATGTERVRIDSAGYVGIGTSDPQQPLHINHTTPYIRLSDSNAASTTASTGWIEWYWQTTRMAYLGFGSIGSNDFYIHNELNGNMLFRTNNTLRMLIDSTGLVGIGTDTPLAGLDIASYSTDYINLCLGNPRTDNTNKNARMGSVPYDIDQKCTSMLYSSNSGTYSRLYIGGGTTYMNSVTELRFCTAGNTTTHTGTERMRIEGDGGVFLYSLSTDTVTQRVGLNASNELVIVSGDIVVNATVTLYDGTTVRNSGTAKITIDPIKRIVTVCLPGLSSTITASTTTKLVFSGTYLYAPSGGATVIVAPLKNNSTDILGVLWIKNDGTIELHTSNPWGYLAAGTGGIVETDFSYKY